MREFSDESFKKESYNHRGIVTIAHTKNKYARQAVNLAISTRLYNPDIPLAVVSDLSPVLFSDYYDHLISWDFTDSPGLVSKLNIYDMSPFNETLFIDADCLVIRPLDSVFEYFSDQEFAVFGINAPHPQWFLDIDQIRERVPSDTYPAFNGGIYYFKKSDFSKKVFQLAKDLLTEYDSLKIKTIFGFPNEEPLVSLAMAKLGLLATDDKGLDVMYAPAGMQGSLKIDVLAGQCSFVKYGNLVEPYIMHFASDDTCYEYFREELRLKNSIGGNALSPWKELFICSLARVKWFFIRFIPLHSIFLRNKLSKTLSILKLKIA